ncbi:hypothetical protein Poli38472_014236 [Pythium oligandrum]|uniref:Uncharacterized protein n=1 Tax=Pythium oligandrum TaxID=41045 RepID=A0A8K1CID0_PYTOL|nr:hypothetical protein Poli38472_014236 [Pythium oligandrum]|eukprot:TMW64119.1 hypothetical protein Poli38472_014236 [Pythium oligandrum]
MADTNDSSDPIHSSVKALLFVGIALLALLPLSAMIWRSTNLRATCWSKGWHRCVVCCDRYFGARTSYDQTDLRTLQELEEAAARDARASYQRYSRRGPRGSLRLASWREDVRRHSTGDILSMKLDQIQTQAGEHRDTMGQSDDEVTAHPTTDAVPVDLEAGTATSTSTVCTVPTSTRPPRADEDEEKKEEVVCHV